MPARDKIHQAVIRALEKRGWRIIREHYRLFLPNRAFYIDLHAQDIDTHQDLLIEVKSFDETLAFSDALANALGKYLLYRQALIYIGIDTPIYLAIPKSAYDKVMDELWLSPLIERLDVRWIVVDTVSEEVVSWT